METRGYGTIFGTEQSGARDVGMDMQAQLIEEALRDLRKQLMLPVPECRIELGLPLEKFGSTKLGPLPKEDCDITRWEGALCGILLDQYFPAMQDAPNKNAYTAQDARRDLFSATSHEGIKMVGAIWRRALLSANCRNTPKDGKQIPSALLELLRRVQLRIILRFCGAQEICRVGDRNVLIRADGLTESKWKDISVHLEQEELSSIEMLPSGVQGGPGYLVKGVFPVMGKEVEAKSMPSALIKV